MEALGGWVWRGQVVLGIVQALSRRASPGLCSPFEVDRADPQALPQPVASQTSVAHPTVMVVGDQPSDAALDHRPPTPATVVELDAGGADAGGDQLAVVGGHCDAVALEGGGATGPQQVGGARGR